MRFLATLFSLCLSSALFSASENQQRIHDSRILEAGAFLYFGPYPNNTYSYDDIKQGTVRPAHSFTSIINPSIEGAFYPLNIISRFIWPPEDSWKYALLNFGIDAAATKILFPDRVSFSSVADCEKVKSSCAVNSGQVSDLYLYSFNITRIGIQYSIRLFDFANGSVIKARFSLGQNTAHIIPNDYAKNTFAGLNMNIQDTTVKDFYLRTLISWDIQSPSFPVGGYLGLGLVYVRKSLGFGNQGIETISDIFNMQVLAGVAY